MKISFLMQWMGLNDPILLILSHQYSRGSCTNWSRFVSLERSEYTALFDVLFFFFFFVVSEQLVLESSLAILVNHTFYFSFEINFSGQMCQKQN